MSLKETIESDIKQAMRDKDKDKLRALRSIKSMILLAESEKNVNARDLDEATETQILSRAAKQRKESIEFYKENGREDLAANEEADLEVINSYLPQPMTEDELKEALQKIINEEGASSPQDMGKVMGRATKELAGKADNKTISNIVKNLLNQ